MSSSRAKGLMYELKKKTGTVLTSKSVGTGPSSYEKRIHRAAVSKRLRNTSLECLDSVDDAVPPHRYSFFTDNENVGRNSGT